MTNVLSHPLFLLIVVLVGIILFGSKKLPSAARGLGQSLRIFKSEMKQMKSDDGESGDASPAMPPQLGTGQPGASPAPAPNPDTQRKSA